MPSIFYIVCVVAVLLSGIGAMWEAFWWHEFISIDLYGAPPHIVYHVPLLCAFVFSFISWIRTKQTIDRWITIFLVLGLLSIPYGIWWDQSFDLGNRSSLSLYTSSHYLVFGVLHFVICLLLLQKLPTATLQQKTKIGVGTLLCAELLINGLIRVRPFLPTGGVHALWGFWGVGVITFVIISIFAIGRHALATRWCATKISLWYVGIYSLHWLIGWSTFAYLHQSVTPIVQMLLGGFRDPPFWITTLGLLVIAICIDLSKKYTYPTIFATGSLYAAIVYGCGVFLLPVDFQYDFVSSVIAMIAGGIGGVCALACVQYFQSHEN